MWPLRQPFECSGVFSLATLRAWKRGKKLHSKWRRKRRQKGRQFAEGQPQRRSPVAELVAPSLPSVRVKNLSHTRSDFHESKCAIS